MKKRQILLVILFALFGCQATLFSQDKMQWFEDARLGIFIHWGIYAVDGIDESWSFFNGYISHEDYMKQLDGFTASNYDPAYWAELIAESGAKYAVLTSKHHDGVALWDSKFSDVNVVDRTPAGRDLIAPLEKQLRKKDIKVGIYYSLLDWSHPDYPIFTREKMRYENDSIRWKQFTEFNFNQINEIATQYNPDLWWFDGDWEQSTEAWKAAKIKDLLIANNPATIVNSRLADYGDYATPEQGVPVFKPKDKYWELCMTMNDSWGFQHNDRNYKSAGQIVQIFADVISKGGNLLLDIGPKADGSIPDEQIDILKELGRWTNKNSEAIYGSRAGIDKNYFSGSTTLSADSTTLFLFVDGRPNGPIALKGLKNKINRIRVVGIGTKLEWNIKMKSYWSEKPGIVYIDIPESLLEEHITVIAVQLDGKIDLWREERLKHLKRLND